MSKFIPADAPIIDPRTGAISFQWLRLFDDLANGTGNIPWANLDFTGSKLSDILTVSASSLNTGTVPLARLSGITNTQIAALAGIVWTKVDKTGAVLSDFGGTVSLGQLPTLSQLAFYGRTVGGIGAGVTTYIGPWDSLTEPDTFFVCPVAGTARNLYVVADAAPGVGQTFTYTARKNQVDQAITCTTSGANKTSSDATHTFTVAAGDLLTVKLVTSAGAAIQKHQIGLEVATA